jgi:adenylate kinase family enzyme
MQRVAIVGSPGSGKSTLARELARRTGLPVVHLDEVYWRPGWVEPPREEWHAAHDAALAGDRWIADGNYGSTMDDRLRRADTVVFLDLPTWLCLARVLRRTLPSVATGRGHLGPDFPDRLDVDFLRFLLYVARFRSTRRPGVLERLSRFPGRVVVLRDRRAIREWRRSAG